MLGRVISGGQTGVDWGRKYFSLLAPERLDDYHNADYQRFHLVKMLQVPPEGGGRYLCAGRFSPPPTNSESRSTT
jgi:hypothetical protein